MEFGKYATYERSRCVVGARDSVNVGLLPSLFSHKNRRSRSRTPKYAPVAHARDRRFLWLKTFGALRSLAVCPGKYACDFQLMRISLGVKWWYLLAGDFPNFCSVNS